MTRLIRILVAATTLTALVAGPAAADDEFEYVALGDSSAAGPLILPQIDLPCLRSSRNYPHVAAWQLGARLTDVTCSGAVIPDLAGVWGSPPRWHSVPPQFNALKPSTDLVTVAIGGNDTGLVAAALSCINLAPEPFGASCKARFTAGGHDQLAARIAATAAPFGQALDRIHALAPDAKVLVTGYGTYLRPGGCFPVAPLWPRDADYLQATIDRLNTMLATVSARHNAAYVDFRTPSIGHDVCAPIGERWLEGLVPSSITAPLHPSALGMAAFGRIVARSATLLMLTAVVAAPTPASAAAAVDGRWAQPGPYAVSVQVRAAHTLYYPTRLDGRHPVVVWGNGTFAWPGIYGDLLRHLASHGIIVAAANTSFSGTGVEMRAGIDLMTSLNGDQSSPFYQHVDLGHVGATGHSQGGLGAINAGADPRIDTVVPIQPGPGGDASKLRGPGLFLAGERDTTVRPAWVVADWDEADQVPAIYGALRGADHFVPTGNGGGFRGVITAWFRFHLMADERARGEFFGAACGLCTDAAWTDVRRNAKALAVPGS